MMGLCDDVKDKKQQILQRMGLKPTPTATRHPHLRAVLSTRQNLACFGFHDLMELTPAL